MRISPKLLVFEILAFLLFAVLAGAGFLAWRLTQGPIDLSLIKPQVERSLSEARGGRPVDIDSLALEWVSERGRVEVAARDLRALDKEGDEVFRAGRAVMSFEAAALLSGKFKTERMRLEDGGATVVRSAEGVWSLADIVIAREPQSGGRPFDPLRDLNWSTLATPIRALISAGSFERVELTNFNVTVEDRKLGARWGANPVEGLWTAGPDGVAFSLDVKLVGQHEPNRVGITLFSNGDVSEARGELNLSGVDPMSIARMFGYTGDGFSSGMPANAVFSVEATEAGGLQSSRLMLSDVNGRARVGGFDISVAGLALDAGYDPATKELTLDSLSIKSDRLTGEFSGSASLVTLMAGDLSKPVPFKLNGEDFEVGLTPVFEGPWAIKAAEISGAYAPGPQTLRIDSLDALTGEARVRGKGDIWSGPIGGAADAPYAIGMKATATAEGVITPQQVLRFWPVNLGSGGREWVRNHIPDGRATRADFSMDWPPGATSVGYLPDEHLTLDFEVAEATVKFLPDFPPVTGVKGVGHMEGNSLVIDVSGGKLGTWQVDEGKVTLPRFHPKGEIMEVHATGRGELRDLMRVLEESNLKVGTKYGLAIERMAGTGGIEVLIRMPMQDDLSDGMKYEITGGFREAVAPDIAAGFGLSNTDARFEVTERGLTISGGGKFGPAPVVFEWKEDFKVADGADGAHLTASARATPDLLNAFGFAARNIMQGEAAVQLRAEGPGGRDFSSITADVDLTLAALEIAELGWRKGFDTPARGQFRYGRDTGGATVTGDIRSDGLELIGEVKLDTAGDFQSALIERIFSRDAVDLRGGVAKKQDGGLRFTVSGPYFDFSPWMSNIMSSKDEAAVQPPSDGVSQGGPDPAMDFAVTVDRLKLRDEAVLSNAVVNVEIDSSGPLRGRVNGQIAEGKQLRIAVVPQGDARRITLHSDDAGFGARVLADIGYFQGGQLQLDGTMKDGATEATITATDVRMLDTPLVAQLLSLASLRGLADVLNGEGVLFTRIEVPVKLQAGRVELPGLRASGPAMGLTARGWVAPASGEISLDGVLVPSFGVNSVLGGLPIIGDLFVSRQGEGLFAPTYSVRGTLAQARVSINPVAAMTPGVLRRIFENPSEPPPEVAPAN